MCTPIDSMSSISEDFYIKMFGIKTKTKKRQYNATIKNRISYNYALLKFL